VFFLLAAQLQTAKLTAKKRKGPHQYSTDLSCKSSKSLVSTSVIGVYGKTSFLFIYSQSGSSISTFLAIFQQKFCRTYLPYLNFHYWSSGHSFNNQRLGTNNFTCTYVVIIFAKSGPQFGVAIISRIACGTPNVSKKKKKRSTKFGTQKQNVLNIFVIYLFYYL
jgi:hypothetical protein